MMSEVLAIFVVVIHFLLVLRYSHGGAA